MKNMIVETVIVRKPSNLVEVETFTNNNKNKTELVLVSEVIKLSEKDYNDFVSNFMNDYDFLKDKGGYNKTYRNTVLIYCPNKPCLVIDPEGYSYARYVGLVHPEFTPLETENKEWGCWHELNIALNDNEILTKQYWNEISAAINYLSNLPAEEVKELLDSRFGRHLVDEFFDIISNKESFITAFCNKYTKSDILKAKSYYC